MRGFIFLYQFFTGIHDQERDFVFVSPKVHTKALQALYADDADI